MYSSQIRALAILSWIAIATAAVVEPARAQFSGGIEIEGLRLQGQTLKMISAQNNRISGKDWPDDFTFQWVRIYPNGFERNITNNATSISYTLKPIDVGRKIKAKASSGGRTVSSTTIPILKNDCPRRTRHEWCTELWSRDRDLASVSNPGTFRGYQAIGQYGVGQLGDGSYSNRQIRNESDEWINTIGSIGVRLLDNSRDRIFIGLTREEWLPSRSFFRIGPYKFTASSGKTGRVGEYEWNRPRGMRWNRYQAYIVSANIMGSSSYIEMTEADALAILDDLTAAEISAAVFDGEGDLEQIQLDALDYLGNQNGYYDLGDLLFWIKTYDEAGEEEPNHSAALLMLLVIPVGRRRRSGYALALLATVMAWSCVGDQSAVVASEDPGALFVELSAPVANRDIGLLLDLGGPDIEDIRAASGLELPYTSSAANDLIQVVVQGPLSAGTLLRFNVPDRNLSSSLYWAEVREVVGEDYELRSVEDYDVVISSGRSSDSR